MEKADEDNYLMWKVKQKDDTGKALRYTEENRSVSQLLRSCSRWSIEIARKMIIEMLVNPCYILSNQPKPVVVCLSLLLLASVAYFPARVRLFALLVIATEML